MCSLVELILKDIQAHTILLLASINYDNLYFAHLFSVFFSLCVFSQYFCWQSKHIYTARLIINMCDINLGNKNVSLLLNLHIKFQIFFFFNTCFDAGKWYFCFFFFVSFIYIFITNVRQKYFYKNLLYQCISQRNI